MAWAPYSYRRRKYPSQNFETVTPPIAYYSATFIQAERNYDIYERELLAVVRH